MISKVFEISQKGSEEEIKQALKVTVPSSNRYKASHGDGNFSIIVSDRKTGNVMGKSEKMSLRLRDEVYRKLMKKYSKAHDPTYEEESELDDFFGTDEEDEFDFDDEEGDDFDFDFDGDIDDDDFFGTDEEDEDLW